MSTASGAPDPFPTDRPYDRVGRANVGRSGTTDPTAAQPAESDGTESGTAPADSHRGGPPHPASPLATALTAAAGATVTAAIPLSFPPGGGPTSFDLAVNAQVDPRLDPRPWVAEVLALATNTGVVLAVLCGGAAWFAWQRKWWEAATMVAVPEVAVAINAWALKPWWSRPLQDYLAYPSGHTVHLVSVVATLVLLLRSARARIALTAVTAVAWSGAGIGMVALDYHLATDIVGGTTAGITLAIVLYWVSVYTARTLGARSG
ncbi:phosphatase PAP2 family protein [Nocardia sp. NBC_00416]|uniref:phosphatase PAP2 family protein n=1 Tax=Nocardia sp. NBC_00416 TaxID=2975991 RepID=UPI002E1EADB5